MSNSHNNRQLTNRSPVRKPIHPTTSELKKKPKGNYATKLKLYSNTTFWEYFTCKTLLLFV